MTRTFFIILLSLLTIQTFSQVRPQFSMYMLNKYCENAAYAGMERSLNFVSTYRDQNNGLAGNPQSFYIGADLPFYLWKGGLGVNFQHSSAGVVDISTLKGSYNRVFDTNYGFLSIGARIGIEQININGLGIITPDGKYETIIDHKDPFLDNTSVSGVGGTWEIGTYYYARDYELGFSIFNLPRHNTIVGLGNFSTLPSFSLVGQYKVDITEMIRLKPSFLIKNQRNLWQAEASVLGEWNRQSFGGMSIRGYDGSSIDAMVIFFGTNINARTKLAYSYDFGLSKLRSVHQGSHEFTVYYNLQKLIGLGIPPKISYNTRHF
jgi:type IX secretion system PorP/SprF family membrane protein